jgi:hypothetical protein
MPVELLTPPATVAAVAGGYRPLLHPTTAGGSAPHPPGPDAPVGRVLGR